MNRNVAICVALLFLISGGALFALAYKRSNDEKWGSSKEKDPDAKIERQLDEFVMTDQQGEKFSSKQLQGKIWMGSVFFASCASECPAQNRKLRLLMNDFADKGLVSVSITCDPEKDTPTAMAEYAKQFNADPNNWHFLTHESLDYIKQVTNEFLNLPIARYTHSDQVVLFDQNGEIHGVYSVKEPKKFVELYNALENLYAKEEQPNTKIDTPPADVEKKNEEKTESVKS